MPPGMSMWSTPDLVIAGLVCVAIALIIRRQ